MAKDGSRGSTIVVLQLKNRLRADGIRQKRDNTRHEEQTREAEKKRCCNISAEGKA